MTDDVTRSTEATSATSASYAARRRRTFANGWWGVALLVATEAALFGTLLSSYWYLRFQTASWPPAGIEPPSVTLPLVLTGALLLTSVPMFLAARAARAGNTRAAWLLILLAVAVQGWYLGMQIDLFASDLDKFSPRDNAYGSVYFTLVGLHHVHVLIGILLSGWIVARLLSGLTTYRLTAMRSIVLYWHFVNAVGILVVLTQVSPSL